RPRTGAAVSGGSAGATGDDPGGRGLGGAVTEESTARSTAGQASRRAVPSRDANPAGVARGRRRSVRVRLPCSRAGRRPRPYATDRLELLEPFRLPDRRARRP